MGRTPVAGSGAPTKKPSRAQTDTCSNTQRPATQEGQEVIRVSVRAEIRYMHLVEGVPKKTVARRLGVDIKTVRRHVTGGSEDPVRQSPKRGGALDAHRSEIEQLVEETPRISAKRIGRLLEEWHGFRHHPRTIRRFVQEVRGSLVKPETFVHRTHIPGETTEIDFGESWIDLDGRLTKIFFFVATLTASNTYFAKAYAFQRLECCSTGSPPQSSGSADFRRAWYSTTRRWP